jgi:hypothetical protein
MLIMHENTKNMMIGASVSLWLIPKVMDQVIYKNVEIDQIVF